MALTREMADALTMAANIDTMGAEDDQTVDEDAAGIDNDGESVIEPGVAFDTPDETAAPMPIGSVLANALAISKGVQDRAAKSLAAMKAQAGTKTLTDAQIKALVITEREHAARGAAVKTTNIITARKPRQKINLGPQGKQMIADAQARGAEKAKYGGIMVHPDQDIRDFERETFAAAKAAWGNVDLEIRAAEYYSQRGLVVTGDATATKDTCGFSVAANTQIDFFNYAMDDNYSHFGPNGPTGSGATAVNVGKATRSRTNIQQPGVGLYEKEIFVVHEMQLRLLGLRVQYAPADITAMTTHVTNTQKLLLAGQGALADDAAIFLPAELVNEFTETNRLLGALFQNGEVVFRYDEKEGMGDTGTKEFQAALLSDIIEDARTTGTSPRSFTRKLTRAYAMTLDPSAKTAGVFTASLKISDAAYFGSKAVTVNSALYFPGWLELVFKLTLRGNRAIPAVNAKKNAQRS